MTRHTTTNARIQLAFTLIISMTTLAPAANYFVSPKGADDNPGTLHEPFATLAKAAAVLKPGDTCYLRDGVYRETLKPTRSGKPGAATTI